MDVISELNLCVILSHSGEKLRVTFPGTLVPFGGVFAGSPRPRFVTAPLRQLCTRFSFESARHRTSNFPS